MTCWKGDIFFWMDEGISCSHCELCKKDSQILESFKHKDWKKSGNVVYRQDGQWTSHNQTTIYIG